MDEIPFTPEVLRLVYAQGFFPMPNPDTGEIMWLSPNPRAVFPLDGFHVSRSLAKTLRRQPFVISFNKDFRGVMAACGDRPDTWINDEFKTVYGKLHDEGYAHSVEVWLDDQLVGGTYGVALGGAFFAESKFHTATDASKIALFYLIKRLCDRGMTLLEVQFMTPHLATLGAVEISRAEYLRRLNAALRVPAHFA